MIGRYVKIQLLAFALLGAMAVAYAGIAYVGLGSLFHKPYSVTAYFKESGGIFSNAAVTYRGVTVGKVGKLTLTSDGVAVELKIDPNNKVPRNTDAVVANLSFVGEQYVDLQPVTADGPMLKQGDAIPVEHTRTPLGDAEFLVGLDRLVNSVPKDDLRVVVDELGKATDGLGPTLSTLIDRGNSLTRKATAGLPDTLDLIRQGKQVLDTANATSNKFRESSRRLASVLQQLRDSDPDITATFANGVYSAQQLDALLKENESQIPPLLANLITLGQIQSLRLPALKQLLVTYPEDIRNGFYNAPGDGTSHFGLVFDQGAPVCTKGYERTLKRSGEATPSDLPAATGAFCNLPVQDPTDVRGSRNAPRPPGDRTDPALAPGAAAASSAVPAGPSTATVQYASYDPLTQIVAAPDGRSYVLQRLNGNADLYPGEGWKELFLGPLSGQ